MRTTTQLRRSVVAGATLGLVAAVLVPATAAAATVPATFVGAAAAAVQVAEADAARLKAPKKGLRVRVRGVPSAARHLVVVKVRGPKGFKARTDRTKTWRKAKPGRFTVTAKPFLHAGFTYQPSVTPRKVKVRKSRGGQSTVTYQQLPCSAQTATLRAWGSSFSGQLGNGTRTSSSVPVPVARLTGVKAVASGATTGYAVCTDGTVWAWGSGSFGKLGNGRASDSTTPVQVGGLTSVSAVAAGDEAAYALRSDGTVWAWGRGHYGALGNGAMLDSNVPVRVAGLTGVTAIASAGYTGYALKDGRIWSWGNNGSGQLGVSTSGPGTDSAVPVQITTLSGVTGISGGRASGYALRSDGSAWSWGSNGLNQLGDGDAVAKVVPVPVSGLSSGVLGLSAGFSNGYVRKANGTVWAWGAAAGGALGNGTVAPNVAVPVPVPGLTGVQALAGGNLSGYALRAGAVWAWGRGNLGQLGNGSATDRSTPVRVTGLAQVSAIAARGHTAYAIVPTR